MIIDIALFVLFFVLRIPLPNIVNSFPFSVLTYRYIADILFVVLFFFLLKFKKTPLSENILGWRKIDVSQVLLGILTALVLFILSLLIIQFTPQEQFYNYHFNLYPYRIYILLIITSFVEELFYRAFIIKRLIANQRINIMSIILASSLFFAMGHIYLGIGGFIFSFLSGMILAHFLIKYKSIIITIIGHTLYNIVFFTMHIYDSSI